MAEEQQQSADDAVQRLKDAGYSCGRLESKIKDKLKDAQEFRRVGFLNMANDEEKSAAKLRALKRQVCKLR